MQRATFFLIHLRKAYFCQHLLGELQCLDSHDGSKLCECPSYPMPSLLPLCLQKCLIFWDFDHHQGILMSNVEQVVESSITINEHVHNTMLPVNPSKWIKNTKGGVQLFLNISKKSLFLPTSEVRASMS